MAVTESHMHFYSVNVVYTALPDYSWFLCLFFIVCVCTLRFNPRVARANTSGYQDPADAYLRVWVKSKGEATAPSATCDSSPYQLPLDRLTKEEAVQKLKSQCMPRRSIRRSSSHSPPQPDSKSRSPARPPASTTTGDLSPMERANVSLQSTLRRTDISLNRSEQLQASLSLSHGDDEDGADAKWLDPEDVMDNDLPAPNEACMTKQSSSSLRRSRSLDDEIPAAVATDVLDLPASRKRSSALSHCRTNSGGGSPIPAHRILCRSRTSSSVGGSPLMDRKRISVADAWHTKSWCELDMESPQLCTIWSHHSCAQYGVTTAVHNMVHFLHCIIRFESTRFNGTGHYYRLNYEGN